MIKNMIPLCYYPTTVVFIDDQKEFLESVVFSLDRGISSVTFTNSLEALDYLKSSNHIFSLDQYLSSVLDKEETEDFDFKLGRSYIEVDFPHIYQKIYDKKRFCEVIVVVVDYSMPNMNGLKLCRELKDQNLYFIMLTGQATEKDVIEAFNSGLIHKYISKSSNQFVEELNQAIRSLQIKKFKQKSAALTKALQIETKGWLEDQSLVNFFEGLLKEKDIIEYYIVNKSGCFLMVDFQGTLYWVVIKSEKEMDEYYNIAKENNAPSDIIQALQDKKKVLFFLTEEESINIPVVGWGKYMHTAKKITTDESQYYYAVIRDKDYPIYPISPEKILSFKEYLVKSQDFSSCTTQPDK